MSTGYIDSDYATVREQINWRELELRDIEKRVYIIPGDGWKFLVNTKWPGVLITELPSPLVIPGTDDQECPL